MMSLCLVFQTRYGRQAGPFICHFNVAVHRSLLFVPTYACSPGKPGQANQPECKGHGLGIFSLELHREQRAREE